MFPFFDPTFLMLIPAMIFAFWAQWKVQSTYQRYSRVPASAATRRSSSMVVGSSPMTSSPTIASAIARRMAGVGLVTVSLRRSTVGFKAISPRKSSLERSVRDEPGGSSRVSAVQSDTILTKARFDPRSIPSLAAIPERMLLKTARRIRSRVQFEPAHGGAGHGGGSQRCSTTPPS